jgi:hypothetical protein
VNEVAASTAIPLSYETHPDLSKLTKHDVRWLQETWEAVQFWDRCRGHWSELFSVFWIWFLLSDIFGRMLTATWLSPWAALDTARLFSRNTTFLLWWHILRSPCLYVLLIPPAFIWIVTPYDSWRLLLFICLISAALMILVPIELRQANRALELSRRSLPPSSRQWVETILKTMQLPMDATGLPRVHLRVGTFRGKMTVARAGDLLISYKGTVPSFSCVEDAAIEAERPPSANAASPYRLKLGERVWRVWLFEKDRAELAQLISNAERA